MKTVKQVLLTSKIDPLIIPGGCTKYIQAPDVSWNKPFKANVTEKYDGTDGSVKPTLLLPRETCVLHPGERLLGGTLRRGIA